MKTLSDSAPDNPLNVYKPMLGGWVDRFIRARIHAFWLAEPSRILIGRANLNELLELAFLQKYELVLISCVDAYRIGMTLLVAIVIQIYHKLQSHCQFCVASHHMDTQAQRHPPQEPASLLRFVQRLSFQSGRQRQMMSDWRLVPAVKMPNIENGLGTWKFPLWTKLCRFHTKAWKKYMYESDIWNTYSNNLLCYHITRFQRWKMWSVRSANRHDYTCTLYSEYSSCMFEWLLKRYLRMLIWIDLSIIFMIK